MPDLQYREALREKLLDLSGELKTGRNEFSTGSVMYRSLNNSISAVLKVLEDHEGEDVLDNDARRELEDKIVLMKRQAKGYARHKTEEGGLIVVSRPAPTRRISKRQKSTLRESMLLRIS